MPVRVQNSIQASLPKRAKEIARKTNAAVMPSPSMRASRSVMRCLRIIACRRTPTLLLPPVPRGRSSPITLRDRRTFDQPILDCATSRERVPVAARAMLCPMTSRALITGITGQDGSYLAELLLEKGYEVHGLIRRSSQFNTGRIDHLYHDPHEGPTRLFLHYADLTDSSSLIGHLHAIKPAEVYNLGAQSHVKVSFEIPEYTAETAAMGALRMLEAMRTADWPIRFYQAGSSEMYGKVQESPQTERTPFNPRSPYAISKVFAHFMTIDYREAYGLHASNGILFNHESPRRGGTFVTRKVTRGIAAILAGKQEHLFLGNLEAKRDWGYAKEYVDAMWRMLQQPEPDDYVIATGEMHSVRELCEVAFGLVGLDWERYVRVDERYLRPTEVDDLCGDAAKAHAAFGWQPAVRFPELVRIMLEADLMEAGVRDALSATSESR